jgi:hypothetical protein
MTFAAHDCLVYSCRNESLALPRGGTLFHPLAFALPSDPQPSNDGEQTGGWSTLRSLKGGIPRTSLSWDSESRCTTPVDARIFPRGRPLPIFVAGTTHLKLLDSNAVGLRQEPSQNPKWLTIGNTHPLRKTQRMGHPVGKGSTR